MKLFLHAEARMRWWRWGGWGIALWVAGCSNETVTSDGGAIGDTSATCVGDRDCDDGTFCNGAERCMPSASAANARGCVPATAPCPIADCDELADRCRACPDPDHDHDGHDSLACGGDDCDDQDATRSPALAETCDAADHDEDCDPTTFGDRDADGDGALDATCCNVDTATGARHCGNDCDDSAITVSPLVAEVCNGRDDDCDTSIDEGVQLVLWPDADGDGYGDAMASATSTLGCAESPGRVAMRGDCNDGAAGIHEGAPEVCNDLDEDCDMVVDDIRHPGVVCHQSETVPCTTACGPTGVRHCSADCLGFDACIADEVCNGCDDDMDGVADNAPGLECVRGVPAPCTTMCGTPGSQACDATCHRGACLAQTESCNYCDDDGDGAYINQESSLAVATALLQPQCSSFRLVGSPTTPTCEIGAGTIVGGIPHSFARLVTGSGAGAAWVLEGSHVGYGAIDITVEMRVRRTATGIPDGGWAVVLATGPGSDVGAPSDLGVPLDRSGLSIEWRHHHPIMSGSEVDRLRVRRLPGGTFLGLNLGVFDGPSITANDLDSTSALNTWITQQMRIVYTPENPVTAGDQERLQVYVNGGTSPIQTLVFDTNGMVDDRLELAHDLAAGGPLSIAVVAGGATRAGDMELHVSATTPVSPFSTQYFSTVQRSGVCP